MAQVVFNISRTAKVEADAQSFTGEACHTATKRLLSGLRHSGSTQETMKPEYYQTESTGVRESNGGW